MKMTTQSPQTNENEVERDNPWLAEAVKHDPKLSEAVAILNDRLIHGGGTKTPPEGAESICWYADENGLGEIRLFFPRAQDGPPRSRPTPSG